MENIIDNEQVNPAAHTAEAEMTDGAAVGETSLGKFKDAKSLLEAYNSLQAEFTRRSQKLRQLEGALEDQRDKAGTAPCQEQCGENEEAVAADFISGYPKAEGLLSEIKQRAGENITKEALERAYIEILQEREAALSDEEVLSEIAFSNEKIKEKVIRRYLKDIAGRAPSTVLLAESGGGFVAAPPKRPKTIDEAGELAYELFKGRK